MVNEFRREVLVLQGFLVVRGAALLAGFQRLDRRPVTEQLRYALNGLRERAPRLRTLRRLAAKFTDI